ncbi:MAG: hypothetical protein O7G85_01135 [Planctomycetota bacterium]|nr:hypothetical protein [Planctomycetota bacterium]
MSVILGYIPFLHPLSAFHDLWYLLIVPLAFGISMIYKALRLTDLNRFWRQVGIMTLQIILGIIGLAIALLILVQMIIPALPGD